MPRSASRRVRDRGTRCIERTRRRGQGVCACCAAPIEPGQRYRELVLADGGFVRRTAHAACIASDPDWACFVLDPADAGLAAVRREWGHRYRVGVQVLVNGLMGHIVGGEGRWVLVDVCGAVQRHEPRQLRWTN